MANPLDPKEVISIRLVPFCAQPTLKILNQRNIFQYPNHPKNLEFPLAY